MNIWFCPKSLANYYIFVYTRGKELRKAMGESCNSLFYYWWWRWCFDTLWTTLIRLWLHYEFSSLTFRMLWSWLNGWNIWMFFILLCKKIMRPILHGIIKMDWMVDILGVLFSKWQMYHPWKDNTLNTWWTCMIVFLFNKTFYGQLVACIH